MAGFGPIGSTPVGSIGGGAGPVGTFFAPSAATITLGGTTPVALLGLKISKTNLAVASHPPPSVLISKTNLAVASEPLTGFTLALDPGTFAVAGSAAAPKVGRLLRAYDNLVLNGDFTVDASDWTVEGADTTFVAANGLGVLALGPSAASGYAWQAVAVVPGRRYTLSAFLKPTNGYTLSASPGSYLLEGTDAAITYTATGSGGGGAGGSSGPAVSFSGDSLTGTQYARWTLGSDGYIYKQHNSGAAVQAGPWIVPQIGMSGYEVRATLVSGDSPAGTLNTWLSVGQTWGFSAVSTDHECVLLIEIRDATTLTVVASGDVDIFAAGLA